MKKTKNISIAYIFNKNLNEIFSLLNENKINECRVRVLQLLEDKTISDREAVNNAKAIFNRCNDAVFMSTLMTYITCSKVS